MKMLLTIFLLSFSIVSTAQVTKECHPTVDLSVTFKKIKDSAQKEYGTWIRESELQLKPLNESYEVISFVVSSSNAEGDVMEAMNTGARMQVNALMLFSSTTKEALVYFDCIKARHKSGLIYTLNPLTMRIEDIKSISSHPNTSN